MPDYRFHFIAALLVVITAATLTIAVVDVLNRRDTQSAAREVDAALN